MTIFQKTTKIYISNKEGVRILKVKNKIFKYSSIIEAFFLFGFFSASALAATHYVSPNGSASWANSTNIEIPCSLATANSNASAGDLIYMRGGTYTGNIDPSNSGSENNRITYQNYNGETVTLSGEIYLYQESYITVDGINVEDPTGDWCAYMGGNNISMEYGSIIQNCSLNRGLLIRSCSGCQFLNNTMDLDSTWAGIVVDGNRIYRTTQTRIEGNTLTGAFSGTDAITLHLGDDSYPIGSYHILKNNSVTMIGGENCYDITSGDHIVLDGNSCTGAGNQNSNIGHARSRLGFYTSWVRVVNHTSYNAKYSGSEQIYIGGLNYLQLGRSIMYGTGDSNLRFADEASGDPGNHHIRIFHNVFDGKEINGSFYSVRSDSYISDVKMKNNIFLFDNSLYQPMALSLSAVKADHNLYWDEDNSTGSNLWAGTYKTLSAIQTNLSQELNGDEKNPLFENAGSHDYTITPGSPAYDTGGWLAKITSSTGSGTTFTVDDALWFYDGWNIAGETGDVIKTENGQTSTITSINYNTGEITVNKSISWTNGEGVGLYFNGNRPDIGAFEYSYSISGSLSPPEGLIIKAN